MQAISETRKTRELEKIARVTLTRLEWYRSTVDGRLESFLSGVSLPGILLNHRRVVSITDSFALVVDRRVLVTYETQTSLISLRAIPDDAGKAHSLRQATISKVDLR